MELMEHYINNNPTGIIEPDTEENRARAIKWAQAYLDIFELNITLSLKPVKRKVKVD